MEKVEGKSGEVGGEREGSLGEKLRREALVGRKGGPRTPVLSWRLSAPRYTNINQKPFPGTVSARKLGAALWEFEHYVPHSQMNTGVDNGVTAGADSSRRRRSCHLSHNEKGLDLSHFPGHGHPFSASAEQVAPAFVPASPARIKGRIGDSHYGLKTSTQLLKVLNRIWSSEEQQVSNIALIKALKAELDHTLVNISDLIQQRNAEQGEIDDFIKQFAEDNLVRKNKERNRIEVAVQSAKAELDDERKLRKRSESFYRKLACNLSDVKSSLSNTLKDLEMEKRSRILLEVLCDEFARGVKDYEQEMHALKQKSDKTCPRRTDHDRLILHISESWLDERMQMQNDAESGRMEQSSAAGKLYFEIGSFLQHKHKHNHKHKHKHKHVDADTICGNPLRMGRWSSIESISFNEVASAPQVVAGAIGDSIDSDELNKPSRDDNFTPDGNERMKLNGWKRKLRSRDPMSLQVKFEEQMAWAMANAGNGKSSVGNGEGGTSHNSEHREGAEDGDEGNKTVDKLVSNNGRTEQSSGGGGNMHPLNDYGEACCSNKGWMNQASPTRQWELKTPEADVSGVVLHHGASWFRGEHSRAKASRSTDESPSMKAS